MENLCNEDSELRMFALDILKDLLTKHEFDARYQDPLAKLRIAGVYFSFVLHLCEVLPRYVEVSSRKLRSLQVCAVLHLRCCDISCFFF